MRNIGGQHGAKPEDQSPAGSGACRGGSSGVGVFRSKLDALQSFVEAQRLVAESPPPDAPGRRYYSNLGFLLQAFIVPDGSSYEEKALYLQFIQRLDAAGSLKPGAGQKVAEELRRAMRAPGPWYRGAERNGRGRRAWVLTMVGRNCIKLLTRWLPAAATSKKGSSVPTLIHSC